MSHPEAEQAIALWKSHLTWANCVEVLQGYPISSYQPHFLEHVMGYRLNSQAASCTQERDFYSCSQHDQKTNSTTECAELFSERSRVVPYPLQKLAALNVQYEYLLWGKEQVSHRLSRKKTKLSLRWISHFDVRELCSLLVRELWIRKPCSSSVALVSVGPFLELHHFRENRLHWETAVHKDRNLGVSATY